MIQAFAKNSRFAPPRRAAAVLLAFVLNVALVPCAMAIEVVADEHECCPSELRLEPSECCDVNDGTIQARGAKFELDKDDTLSPATDCAAHLQTSAARHAPVADPPDPPDLRPDLNALFCVYLK